MRTFNFKFDNGDNITLGAPLLKVYKQLYEISNDGDLVDAIALALGKDAEYVEDNFNTDEIGRFYLEYMAWIKNTKQSDPN